MHNKDGTPREYRYIDPEKIDASDVQPDTCSNAECLANALLDVIQVSQDAGMTERDVDEAMRIIQDTLANTARARFRLHVGDKQD